MPGTAPATPTTSSCPTTSPAGTPAPRPCRARGSISPASGMTTSRLSHASPEKATKCQSADGVGTPVPQPSTARGVTSTSRSARRTKMTSGCERPRDRVASHRGTTTPHPEGGPDRRRHHGAESHGGLMEVPGEGAPVPGDALQPDAQRRRLRCLPRPA